MRGQRPCATSAAVDVMDGSYTPSDKDTVSNASDGDQDSSVDITSLDRDEEEEQQQEHESFSPSPGGINLIDNRGYVSDTSIPLLSTAAILPLTVGEAASVSGLHCAVRGHRYGKIRKDLNQRPQNIDVTTETVSPYRQAHNIHHHIVSKRQNKNSSTCIDVFSPPREWDVLPLSPNASPTRAFTPRAIYQQGLATSAALTEASSQLSKGRKVWILTVLSLVSNIILFTAKVYISVASRSLAVMASAVDSLLDLISQIIIFCALQGSQNVDVAKWPVGRSRLEPVGIIICASLMGMASLQIVYESISGIVVGVMNPLERKMPLMNELAVTIMTVAIVTKAILFLLCATMRKQSPSVNVLAEDHRNDVLSNLVALLGAYFASLYPVVWWIDPAGAIAISIYICVVWMYVAQEQTEMLVGKSAEPEFLVHVTETANNHHDAMFVDVVRAYHFGKRYLVELEVILPETMQLQETHDIALSLQKAIEKLREVERAFVHVDYMERDEDEHKVVGIHTPPPSPPLPLHAVTEVVHDGVSDSEKQRLLELRRSASDDIRTKPSGYGAI